MNHKVLIMATFAALSFPLFAENNAALQKEITQLQKQTKALQSQLGNLQKKLLTQPAKKKIEPPQRKKSTKLKQAAKPKLIKKNTKPNFHDSLLLVHTYDGDPKTSNFYPTALVADGKVVTYIAGTPVVSGPYLGARPAFDGSDYIVNISSINRDIRLMQQRQRLFNAYERVGYPLPNMPILILSGKLEPVGELTRSYLGDRAGDLTLGAGELDVAAPLNDKVEGYIGISYDDAPPSIGGPRVGNSAFRLNMGFVNIGDLDETPYYLTAGQIYAPFGRYSSAMISAPLPLRLIRTKTRPVILGYKSQYASGPFAAIYGYKSDTTLGSSGVGGVNLGYTINSEPLSGELGVSYIASIDDSAGMQVTGSAPRTTFGGFSSITNGNEAVRKVPGVGAHGSISFDRYNLTAEWVGATSAFRPQDLSFNGRGAKPQALQLEAGVTFMAFCKPSSVALGYQWSKDTLALNLPQQRIAGVFNISLWKDTIESLEYRHDIDFKRRNFANGAAPIGLTNLDTWGTGRSSDSLIAQIGVYF